MALPELPEVETVVRDLRPMLVGRSFTTVWAGRKQLRSRWQRRWGKLLGGKEIAAVRRRGKWIVVDLPGELHLVIHLGMTGQLLVAPQSVPTAKHTHLVFGLAPEPHELRFVDIRRFGSATLHESTADLEAFFHATALGPEPFGVQAGYWRRRLASTRRCLKAILLDQRMVAGVGNIYADESLFEAKLHPARLGCDLTEQEADRLRRAIEQVLNRAINKRGSSIRNYVGGSGLRGGYQEEFRAYGRTGKPCRRCHTALVGIRLAGRATHFCPACQLPAVEQTRLAASLGRARTPRSPEARG
jgi:formamidopyrimidine-DNA glycosylase